MRTFSSNLIAILTGASIPVRQIARVTTGSGTYYVCDADSDISWNGQTYTALDRAFGWEADPQTSAAKGRAGRMRLSYTDPAVLSLFQLEDYRAKAVVCSTLILDPVTQAGVEEIVGLGGRMDYSSIDEGRIDPSEPDKPTLSTLTVEVAPHTVDLDRPGTRTRSDEDQRAFRDSVDGFFKDVAQLPTSEMNWGTSGPTGPGGYTGAYSGQYGGLQGRLLQFHGFI